jgi:putative addiction module killer protein
LPESEKESVRKELADLAANGNAMAGKKSKSLGDGLFELRVRQGEKRIYYSYGDNKTIIIKNSGDKQRQDNDIRDARHS